MVKKIIAAVVLFISILAVIAAAASYRAAQNEHDDIAREVADVENKIQAKEIENTQVRVQVLADVAGVSERRLNQDAELFDEVFGVAFTWHNFEEYTAMRATLVGSYGFDPKGQFLTDVFPEMKVSESDPEYNLIDGHKMRIEFGHCQLYCTGCSGLTYRYFGEVTFRSLGANGSSYVLTDAFTAVTDADGNITDLFVIDLLT